MSETPSPVTDLKKYKAEREKRPPVPVEVADAMVMTHLTGCGMQLNLIAKYFIEAGLIDLGEAVGKQAASVNESCKEATKQL